MRFRRVWAEGGEYGDDREEGGEEGGGDDDEFDGGEEALAMPDAARRRRWLMKIMLVKSDGGHIDPIYTSGTPVPHADSRKSRFLGCDISSTWSWLGLVVFEKTSPLCKSVD